jgi:MFS family permease
MEPATASITESHETNLQDFVTKNLRHNYIVNVLDGGFFGFALGFASFTTVIPLFVSSMTNSAILIGLIPAIHMMGWQLPQLFLANTVSRQRTYKPMTVMMTIHERLPFLGLALIAFFLPHLGVPAALALTFLMLIWQGLGGGFTANPWQNMVARIFPPATRATFIGAQTALLSLFASAGAVGSGLLLARIPAPLNYTCCFLVACVWLVLSWLCINQTREPVPHESIVPPPAGPMFHNIRKIWQKDPAFRWYLVSRVLTQFGMMAFAFYVIYAVKHLGMSDMEAGFLTSALFITQVAANPILGWIADRWSKKNILAIGAAAMLLSTTLAFFARAPYWFYPVIILNGLASTIYWTVGLAITIEFGNEGDRPTYIGMANTFIAPATFLAPVLGGWLADTFSFQSTFLVSALFALSALIVLQFFVSNPHVEDRGDISQKTNPIEANG